MQGLRETDARAGPFGLLCTALVTHAAASTPRELDAQTGLYYYRARYYDPSAGRFLSEDPIEHSGGNNFCAYAPVSIQSQRVLGALE